MRTVTFSDKDVQSTLALDFVCTFSNTKGDPTAGQSFSHSPDDQPGPCGPRAGRQNVQLLFMDSDSQIFHAACGFMSPEDMLVETNFAKQLFDELKTTRKHQEKLVAARHYQRLKQLGFTDQGIENSVNQFGDAITSFSPKDLDFQFPQPKIDLPQNAFNQNFVESMQDPSRYRTLRDNRFMMDYPLVTSREFEKEPQNLLGTQKSFFGSKGEMQQLSDFTKQIDFNGSNKLPKKQQK